MKIIKFGTDGWRAVMAEGFTFANLRMATEAVARYLDIQGNEKKIVVGYDQRFQSEKFAEAVAEVLAAHGITVLLTESATPTPVVAFAVLQYQASGAIMLTASHNPPEYNGIKFIPYYAGPAMPEVTDEIEKHLEVVLNTGEGVKSVALEEAINQGLVEYFQPQDLYLKQMRAIIKTDLICRANLKVVVDPMYGAGAGYLEKFLDQKSTVIAIHSKRDPLFGGGLPDPVESRLQELSRRVKDEKAHVGLALDGDADRFGVVDADGKYFSPNEVLPMLLYYLIESRGWKKGSVARTVATSHMLDRIADTYGLKLHETPVGFKYIGLALREKEGLLGGEESGGMSIRGHIPEKDGILAGLLVAEMLATSGGKPLSELQKEMHNKFGELVSRRVDVKVRNDTKKLVIEKLRTYRPERMGGILVKKRLTIDGYKFVMDDNSWVLIRASGTEPVFRIYVEASDSNQLAQIQEEVRTYLGI